MPATTHELIGRGEELAEIVRLLDARERLPAVALMHGDAGIGKTSVWLVGIDAAAERGYRLLSRRPSEAETRLSYAGLSDLLGVVVDDVLSEIPAVQRRSLEAALLLGDVVTPVDERAVAASFLAALRVLAADGPLCVAVDDLQWLDAASAAALSFASSRLDGEPIATLVAVRGKPPSWLRRCLPGSSVVLEVGALSVGAVHELLRTRLGASFPRPTLIRLWETSAGNPFFALELAVALRRRGGARSARSGGPAADPVDTGRASPRTPRRPQRSGTRSGPHRGGGRRADH